jgi:phosphatidylglycerophosphate synthase
LTHIRYDSLAVSALVSEVAGFIAVASVALIARAELPLTQWYPLKAAAIFSIVMLLALAHVHEYHPFARFGPANQLTTARAVVVALIASLIGEMGLSPVASTAALAGVGALALDGLDGWTARRTRMTSPFGARFDVEIDALLIQALAILVWQHGKAGWWVLFSGLIRYGFVAAGWLWPRMNRPLPPTSRGRLICFIQISALILAVTPAITPPVSTTIAALGLAALSWSFLVDTLRLLKPAA